MSVTVLKRTPLHDLHVELGARMVPFAGYEMPVQYPMGVLKEHLHTRAKAGLFDVSHMGQLKLTGFDAKKGLETIVPALRPPVRGRRGLAGRARAGKENHYPWRRGRLRRELRSDYRRDRGERMK